MTPLNQSPCINTQRHIMYNYTENSERFVYVFACFFFFFFFFFLKVNYNI